MTGNMPLLRPFLCLLFLAASAYAVPVELIPGLLSYDMPDFFHNYAPHGDPGDNPFSGQGRPVELGEIGNNERHLRQLNVSIRAVGFTIGNGKRVTTTPVSFEELKKEMELRLHRGPGASKPEETSFAGHKALHVQSITPHNIGFSFYQDTIWVPLTPNAVLEIIPTGTSPELLQTIVDSFSTMKLTLK